jgi:hypothetical protein
MVEVQGYLPLSGRVQLVQPGIARVFHARGQGGASRVDVRRRA